MLLLIPLILSFCCALLVSRLGSGLGLLDTPTQRSSHSRPTPKGGGLGILVVFAFYGSFLRLPLPFVLPIVLLSLLSFLGDIRDISPTLRLIVQLAAATIITLSLCQTNALTAVLLVPLWIFFLAGTTNFYNFMDGINGIAGLTGLVGFGLAGFFLFRDTGNLSYPTLCAGIAAACLGFLPLNIPKARVFMGDVASILLGLLFASMVLLASSSFVNFLCYAALLFPFYIDELTTMALRIKAGDSLTKPHRKHLYQILANEYAIAHWKISFSYATVQFLLGLAVFKLRPQGTLIVLIFLGCCSFTYIMLNHAIRRKAKQHLT